MDFCNLSPIWNDFVYVLVCENYTRYRPPPRLKIKYHIFVYWFLLTFMKWRTHEIVLLHLIETGYSRVPSYIRCEITCRIWTCAKSYRYKDVVVYTLYILSFENSTLELWECGYTLCIQQVYDIIYQQPFQSSWQK